MDHTALRLEGLLLIDSTGNDPVAVNAVTFTDEGIGVIRWRGTDPRILPWSSVVTHVVERWDGGVVPRWWVEPQSNGSGSITPAAPLTDPASARRSLPHTPAGVLIGIKSPFGWYRFILPGGDLGELSRRVTAIAVRQQGPAGASSVTRVVAWGRDVERRRTARLPPTPSGWMRVRPYLVVMLLVVIGTAVTLILLQSAGAIHLPLLGGSSPGTVGGLRIR